MTEEKDFPIVQCFDLASDFLDENAHSDNWLLQLELFDPHEPFTAPERFRKGIKQTGYNGPVLDWPLYDQLKLTQTEQDELTANYLALVAMCDHYLGQLLDKMDKLNLWDDTTIVMTTDHGFLLGEQNWWGKNRMPMYDSISRIPLQIYHPKHKALGGTIRNTLTQTIDIMPTLLDCHGLKSKKDIMGRSLMPALQDNSSIRETALFGIFGGSINVTDGRYVYFRYPKNHSVHLNEYTLMPVHPASYFTAEEFKGAELKWDFKFTDGMPVIKLPASNNAKRPPMQGDGIKGDDAIYDMHNDPNQNNPISEKEIEAHLATVMVLTMQQNQAPPELYERFALLNTA